MLSVLKNSNFIHVSVTIEINCTKRQENFDSLVAIRKPDTLDNLCVQTYCDCTLAVECKMTQDKLSNQQACKYRL